MNSWRRGWPIKFWLALSFAIMEIACGPTAQEREQAQEAERQKAIAASRQTLAEFAKRHGAVPVTLFDPDPLAQPFTAQRQQQLEDKVVAFSASLLDIVRLSGEVYELVLGNPWLDATVVNLKTGEQQAATLLARPREPFAGFLVAAKINEVVPLTLNLEPCHEPDCTEVSLKSEPFSSPLRIAGEALAIEPEVAPGPQPPAGAR